MLQRVNFARSKKLVPAYFSCIRADLCGTTLLRTTRLQVYAMKPISTRPGNSDNR